MNVQNVFTLALRFHKVKIPYASILIAASAECICEMLEQRVWRCLHRLNGVERQGHSVVIGGGVVEVLCSRLLEEQACKRVDMAHSLRTTSFELLHMIHTANIMNGITHAQSLEAVQMVIQNLDRLISSPSGAVNILDLSRPMCFGEEAAVLDVNEFKVEAMRSAISIVKCILGTTFIT